MVRPFSEKNNTKSLQHRYYGKVNVGLLSLQIPFFPRLVPLRPHGTAQGIPVMPDAGASGLPTPPKVLSSLTAAFGTELIGETGELC